MVFSFWCTFIVGLELFCIYAKKFVGAAAPFGAPYVLAIFHGFFIDISIKITYNEPKGGLCYEYFRFSHPCRV